MQILQGVMLKNAVTELQNVIADSRKFAKNFPNVSYHKKKCLIYSPFYERSAPKKSPVVWDYLLAT